MKIFDNKLNKTDNSVNYTNNLPNFRAKKIITTVTNPNSWKFASAATAAVGMSLLALAKNEKQDYSELENFLSEQTTNYESGMKEPAYTKSEVKLIIEMFKENPDLVTQMVLMRSGNKIIESPRFKAVGMKTILNIHKDNPQLVEKLLILGTVKDDKITDYAFCVDDIVKIVDLSKTYPEFIDKAINVTKENYDHSYSTRFTRDFEYDYLVSAYEKNPILTEYMLNVPNLRAKDIEEMAITFKTPEFFMELKDILPEKFHHDANVLNNMTEITKLIQTPIKELKISQKEFVLNLLTEGFSNSTLDIYKRNIPNLDSKINQLKMALGMYTGNIDSTPENQKMFIKNILANNNPESEKVLKTFDFTQYGKQGLPLSYPRKDFIEKINTLTKDLDVKEKDIILQHFGFIPGHDGYDGMLINKPFNNTKVSEQAQQIAKDIKTEIENFTLKNKVKTGNENADRVLNSIIQGLPEFVFYVGKEQHGIQAYSIDIHTLQVLQGAMNNPEYSELSDMSKTILKMAILMHDMGKKGKVQDPGHAMLSGAFASAILEKFPFTEELKNQIVETVNNHHWSADYDMKNATAETVAVYGRHPEAIKMYSIFTQADIEGVNDDLYKILYDGVKNKDDFHKFFKNKMKPIYEALTKMRSQSNFVFDTKFSNNGTKFSTETAMINGQQKQLKVLNFSKLKEGEDLQKYGFAPNVTKEKALFLVHMTRDLEETLRLVKNLYNKVAWSTSLVKDGSNNTVENFGFIFNAKQSDISIAYNKNLSLGNQRNLQDFIKILFLEESDPSGIRQEKYKEQRVFLRDSLLNELANRGYKLTTDEYVKLAEHILSKKFTTQFVKDIKIGNHLIKANDLSQALEDSINILFDKENHNEIECFNPTIKGLFAKVSSLEECPQYFLEFAAKHDLPIVLMPPASKN